MINVDRQNLIKARYDICVGCRDRMSELRLVPGKRRDDAALHYMCGAVAAAKAMGRGELVDSLAGALFTMQFYGFKVLQDIIDRGPQAAESSRENA